MARFLSLLRWENDILIAFLLSLEGICEKAKKKFFGKRSFFVSFYLSLFVVAQFIAHFFVYEFWELILNGFLMEF